MEPKSSLSVCVLESYCAEMEKPKPLYKILRSYGSIVYAVEAFDRKATGFGLTHENAKNQAAANLIDILRLCNHNIISYQTDDGGSNVDADDVNAENDDKDLDDDNDNDDYDSDNKNNNNCTNSSISCNYAKKIESEIVKIMQKLKEHCVVHNYPEPVLRFIDNTEGFTAEFSLSTFVGLGGGRNKIEALKFAAKKAFKAFDESKNNNNEQENNKNILNQNENKNQDQNQNKNQDQNQNQNQNANENKNQNAIENKNENVKNETAKNVTNVKIECDKKVNRGKLKESQDEELFKMFNHLTGNKTSNVTTGYSLADQHNFFSNFHGDIKKKAFCILNESYASPKEQVDDLLKQLNINPTYNRWGFDMVCVDFNCEYDVLLVAKTDKIYDEILNYLSVMLK